MLFLPRPIYLAIFLLPCTIPTQTPTISIPCLLSSPSLYPKPCSGWSQKSHDFIIVGAGTAGCVLANRLSENPKWNVLLLEAGGIPSNLSEIPGFYELLQGTPEDWSFKAQSPQVSIGYKNSSSSWAKGKVLGGSSTINAMVTVPGVAADYDQWASLVSSDWNWLNITKYFDRVYGMVQITRYRSNLQFRNVLEEALKEMGVDTTGNSTFGYRDVPIDTNEGQRFSFAKAYLTPARNRPNLCVVTDILVTSLWFDNNEKVQGVIIDQTTKVKAKKEVILSAGAIKTPQILLQSKIGPLSSRTNLPVGRNLMDHTIIPIWLQDTRNYPPVEGLPYRLQQYCSNRTILDTIGPTNFQGYLNLDPNPNADYNRAENSIFTSPTQPNLELIHLFFPPQEPLLNITLSKFNFLEMYTTKLLQLNQNNNLQTILVTVLHPQSRGTITLSSIDPYNPKLQPNISANYLSHPRDIQTVLEGIQFIERLLSTNALNIYQLIDLGIPECSQYSFPSVSYWTCFAKVFATSIFHASGSCAMGKDPSSSVVNSRLQVWGIDKLRVVDSSVIPAMMSGHTNIPVGMIAEKAADYIKEDYDYN